MDESFLTVMEIAETLKLNPQTIRNWIDRGELPAVRVGPRRVRVRKADFDAFIVKSGRPAADVTTPADTNDQALMMAIMGAYGTTMQQVQMFELALGSLVVAVELAPPSEPPSDPSAFLKRMWRLVHKASAGEMRTRLEGKIPDDLLTEVVALVSWRNFLAHRYLRTRLVSPTGELALGASLQDFTELAKLAQAFIDSSKHLQAGTASVLESAAAAQTGAIPPQALLASIEQSMRRMVLAQPPRFESVESTPSADPT